MAIWGYTKEGKKQHFFQHIRSLCGERFDEGVVYPYLLTEDTKCKKCGRILKKLKEEVKCQR